jgi:hypothetical protein
VAFSPADEEHRRDPQLETVSASPSGVREPRQSRDGAGRGPRVTVVIPVWDAYVEWLPDAVQSARHQGAGIRILVVDNASVVDVPRLDGTHVVSATRRLSLGGARNLGLARVGTEYVAFLDADDLLLHGTLPFLVGRMDADPVLAACATAAVDAETGQRYRCPRRFVPRLARHPRLFALANSVWKLYLAQGCAIFRTAWVRDSGGYADSSSGEGWVVAVSMAFRGRVLCEERSGVLYRRLGPSLSSGLGDIGDLLGRARRVRRRIGEDPGVPAWLRALLPAVALGQIVAISVVRPVYRAAGPLRRGGRAAARWRFASRRIAWPLDRRSASVSPAARVQGRSARR